MGCSSNQRSFRPVVHLTFLNVTVAAPFRQVIPLRCPTLMDGLHHMPQFGGVPTHTSRAMLSGVYLLSFWLDGRPLAEACCMSNSVTVTPY